MNRIGFSQRLELRQSQALVMTPQLQQAIKMLQLSNIELAEFVESRDRAEPAARTRRARARRRAGGREPNLSASGVNGTPATLAEAMPAGLDGDVAGDAAEHWVAAGGR